MNAPPRRPALLPLPAVRAAGRRPRPVHADGVALTLVLVLGLATLATLFRFFQFVAWA